MTGKLIGAIGPSLESDRTLAMAYPQPSDRTFSESERLDLIAKGERLGLSADEIGALVEMRSRPSSAPRPVSGLDDIVRTASETFGSEDKARRWLARPTTVLADLSPREVASAGNTGFGLVLDLLKRIDHGLAV